MSRDVYDSLEFVQQNWSRLSLDTAATGSGDHENYFVQLNLSKYLKVHKNGSLLNADCKTIAVRIRTVFDHQMWPNINATTLLFSNNTKYYSDDALDISNYDFHKAIKPEYG